MARYGMVIDLKRCVGCRTCVVSCKIAGMTPQGVSWASVSNSEVGKYPNVSLRFLPKQCMHCKEAPCVEVCPTGASYSRLDGIVVVDYDKCIGCKDCQVACPYDARTFVEEIKGYYPEQGFTPREEVGYARHRAGVVEKCDFCMARIEGGEEPDCVVTCTAYARHFGDLDDPNSEVSKLISNRHGYQLQPELGTEPSVYYLPP